MRMFQFQQLYLSVNTTGIPGQAGADSQEALLLLAASGAVLLAGLAAAVLYRKRA